MPANLTQYLKPETLCSIANLDLQAQCIVEGFLSGLHRSPFHGFSSEFSEHRKYVIGDEPKTIDWNAFAKTERLYVKKYQAQTNLDCTLLVDISKSMGYRYQRTAMSKLEYCISLSAAISYLLLRQQDSVGLLTFDDRLQAYIKPRSNSRQLAGIIGQLARIQPSAGTDLTAACQAANTLIRHRGLLVIMSDLLDEPETIQPALEQLSFRGHDIILFQVLDHAEITLPWGGAMQFTDSESPDTTVNAVGDDVRDAYTAEIQDHIANIAQRCARLGIAHLFFNTSQQFDVPLRQFLTNRKTRF